MENIIILIILLGVVAFAIRGSVKHFRGEGACCGGGSSSVRPPKKRLTGRVTKTYTLSIDGMHCQNCANNIERAINEIDGASARVNLRTHKAKVCCDREIGVEQIKAAAEERGYKITSYKE